MGKASLPMSRSTMSARYHCIPLSVSSIAIIRAISLELRIPASMTAAPMWSMSMVKIAMSFRVFPVRPDGSVFLFSVIFLSLYPLKL